MQTKGTRVRNLPVTRDYVNLSYLSYCIYAEKSTVNPSGGTISLSIASNIPESAWMRMAYIRKIHQASITERFSLRQPHRRPLPAGLPA